MVAIECKSNDNSWNSQMFLLSFSVKACSIKQKSTKRFSFAWWFYSFSIPLLPCFYESSEIIFTPWLHRALCSLGIKAWDTYADELNQPCNRKVSQVHHEWYRGRNNQDSWYRQTHQGHYSHFAHHAQPNQRYLFSGCHVSSHFLPCTVSVALCNVMYYSFWGQKYKFSPIPPNISIFLWK